jgi:hypothetical protein
MTLFESYTPMDSGAEFIKGFFNDNTLGALNIITTYKPPKLQLSLQRYLGNNAYKLSYFCSWKFEC